MIRIIGKLIDLEHAYAADNGDVFYSVSSFPEYGKLSGHKPDELRAGERVAVDEYKRDPLDFVLWKAAKPGEPSWTSPWGEGRPGWHIECSAMSMDLLGEEFDIHGGGMDLTFPHHENEIAQSEALTKGRFARYWMHNGLVRIDEEKMSKSLNNFLTIKDVLNVYSGEEIRLFIIGSHYRSPLNYARESLESARSALRRFYTALRGHDIDGAPQSSLAEDLAEDYVARFEAAMNDDLNTPEAIAVMHEVAGAVNKEKDADKARVLARTLSTLGRRLGILEQDAEAALKGRSQSGGLSDEAIEALIVERQTARTNRDFARSDEIRDELTTNGIVLEDAGGSTSWRRS